MNKDVNGVELQIGDWVSSIYDSSIIGEIIGSDADGDILLRIVGRYFDEEDPPNWWAEKAKRITEEEAMIRILENS